MCGIAGILGALTDRNQAALDRMTGALEHRGPDGAGTWVSSPDSRGRGCMLGHRRLSILDLSHAGDQPMTDCTGGHRRTLVFNGEIYNFKDLRRDLERSGESFRSSGDTAVMLRLLALGGTDAVGLLRGMFAFALWDDHARQLLLARDPLGIKPLYLCPNPTQDGEWSLVFASEVRSILASGLLGRSHLDHRAVRSMLWNGFVVGPGTAVSGVELLGAGEWCVVNGSGAMRRRVYWSIPRTEDGRPVDEAELRHVVEDSVARHLIADVPVGIFLSGGIDSSSVAALAQRASSTPVHTFTLGFDEQDFNEGDAARAIANAIGTEHHEIRLTEADFTAALDAAIETIDQPTFDGLNSYCISKAVREAGLKVALVGTGGDELFGGYPSFRIAPTLQAWNRRTRGLPESLRLGGARTVSRLLAGSGRTMAPQTRWAKLPDMVRAGDDLTALYQLSYALFLPEFQAGLLSNGADRHGMPDGLSPELSARIRSEASGRTAVSTIAVLEQRLFLGERLLRDTDAASMAVSLEMRLPLVDSAVAEAVARTPDARRFEPLGRKQLLRRIGLDRLDPALFERPKRGFELPFGRWIRTSLGRAMDQTMRDRSLAAGAGLDGQRVAALWSAFLNGVPGLYWTRIWALYVLIRWCHRHRVLA
jgi:asparagine synthase (glutamine-hydrolysing)